MVSDRATAPIAVGPCLPCEMGSIANALSAKPYNAESRLSGGTAGDGAGRPQCAYRHPAPAAGHKGTDTEPVRHGWPVKRVLNGQWRQFQLDKWNKIGYFLLYAAQVWVCKSDAGVRAGSAVQNCHSPLLRISHAAFRLSADANTCCAFSGGRIW